MSISLLGWRRTVAALYAQVRGEADPERAWRLWRDGRDELFASHPDSPIPPDQRPGFTGLRYAPYDPALRIEGVVQPAEPARIEAPTVTDGVVPFERVGQVRLELGTLDVWWLDSYGGGIFVPVKDPSPDTYGGGRYLLDTVKGADLGGAGDRLIIDVNFAYNPSCAYDSRWVCPLAPPGNTLTAPLNVGELAYHPAHD